MKIDQRQENNTTVTYKIDPAQFAELSHLATLFLNLLAASIEETHPSVIQALTQKLKASSDALEAAVKANQPQPPTAPKENHP